MSKTLVLFRSYVICLMCFPTKAENASYRLRVRSAEMPEFRPPTREAAHLRSQNAFSPVSACPSSENNSNEESARIRVVKDVDVPSPHARSNARRSRDRTINPGEVTFITLFATTAALRRSQIVFALRDDEEKCGAHLSCVSTTILTL